MKNLMVAAMVVAVAAGAALAQGGNNAGEDQPQQNQSQSQAQTQGMTGSMSDANLAAMIKAIDQHEVKEGKLAERKAKNKAVKKFARMMVREHGRNDKELASLSKRIGLQPSENSDITAMKDQAQSDVQSIESQTGADFDKTYVDQMVKGHQDALDKLDQAISNNAGRNGDLSSFIQKTRGSVSRHLEMAKKLQSEVGGSQSTQGTESTPGTQGY